MNKDLKKRISAVNKLLVKQFGIPIRQQPLPDPVEMLIATILSQNTNDKNSYRAYLNLKSKCSTWEQAAGLSRSQIEKEIRIAGLAKQKSAAIKNFLMSLMNKQGGVSLSYLVEMKNEAVLTELTSYPGVGTKTASCVLLFALGRNICPVDTHVHRTTNRIGLVNTTTPDKTFILLNEALPDNIAHQFHTNLIRLGREICKSAKPLCYLCPLIKICEYKEKNLEGIKKIKPQSFILLDNVKPL